MGFIGHHRKCSSQCLCSCFASWASEPMGCLLYVGFVGSELGSGFQSELKRSSILSYRNAVDVCVNRQKAWSTSSADTTSITQCEPRWCTGTLTCSACHYIVQVCHVSISCHLRIDNYHNCCLSSQLRVIVISCHSCAGALCSDWVIGCYFTAVLWLVATAVPVLCAVIGGYVVAILWLVATAVQGLCAVIGGYVAAVQMLCAVIGVL